MRIRAELLLSLAIVTLVASCGPRTPPEGFTLAIQMTQVNVVAVDSLRLTIAPAMEGTMRARFVQPTRGTSFENGEIQISVDSASGLLTMVIAGSYVTAHAMHDGTGSNPLLEIELWSDDHEMHGMPEVRGTVIHRGAQVATGLTTLPAWPLPLGVRHVLDVPCMPGLENQCAQP